MDVGILEIVFLAAIGLLIFGPEKLPKAAADAGRILRQIRAMASGARQDLVDYAGIDLSDATDALGTLKDLHPRNLAKSLLDEPEGSTSNGPTTKPGSSANAGGAAPVAFDPDAT